MVGPSREQRLYFCFGVVKSAWWSLNSREREGFRRESGEDLQSKRLLNFGFYSNATKCWTSALRGLANSAGGIIQRRQEEWRDWGNDAIPSVCSLYGGTGISCSRSRVCMGVFADYCLDTKYKMAASASGRVASCGLLLMSLKQILLPHWEMKGSKTLSSTKTGHWVWKEQK